LLAVVPSRRFLMDSKLADRRGWKMAKLESAVVLLATEQPLPLAFKDHPLVGEWKGYRDCHVEPDWVLIY
jgi:mRNA interferase YafQ